MSSRCTKFTKVVAENSAGSYLIRSRGREPDDFRDGCDIRFQRHDAPKEGVMSEMVLTSVAAGGDINAAGEVNLAPQEKIGGKIAELFELGCEFRVKESLTGVYISCPVHTDDQAEKLAIAVTSLPTRSAFYGPPTMERVK